MEENTIKKRVFSGAIWKFLEKISTQAISIVVQIILARILLPEDYGLIGYLMVFVSISDVFLAQGFTTALIQKKDSDQLDFSTVFFANLIMLLIIYAIFYFIAPCVARFYNEPGLTELMRILSLMVVIGSFGAVHNAVLSKRLEFKKIFLRNLANTITYGLSGILFAYLGFEVWALVYSKLIGALVGAIVLWLTVKWKPSFSFSFSRIKSLFKFSSKVLGTNLLNTIFNNINPMIIGKFYSSSELGQYQRGQNIPQTLMTAIDGSISEVMYPTFSEIQDKIEAVKSALRRAIKLSMYIILPMLTGLLVISRQLTMVLLTEKWLPSVPYMQLTCIICMFWPLSARNHALNSLGKSDITFKLSLLSRTISLIVIVIFAKVSVLAIMFGSIIVSVFDTVLVSFYVKKYIHYSLRELIADILPMLSLSGAMGIVVYLISFLQLSSIVTLCIQVPLGTAIYFGASWLFKLESFEYVLNMAKNFINNKKKKG